MLMTLPGLILIGGRRVWHLRYEVSDPVLARFSGLARLPSLRKVSAWLRRLEGDDVEWLSSLNADFVGEESRRAVRKRLTLDVDGSVVSTGDVPPAVELWE